MIVFACFVDNASQKQVPSSTYRCYRAKKRTSLESVAQSSLEEMDGSDELYSPESTSTTGFSKRTCSKLDFCLGLGRLDVAVAASS